MQFTESPLNQQVVERIKGWANSTEAFEFRQIVASLAAREEFNSLENLKQSGGDDGHRQAALDQLQMAKQYHFILHVLDSAALGHTPGEPESKFPFISLKIEQPSAVKSVEELTTPKPKK